VQLKSSRSWTHGWIVLPRVRSRLSAVVLEGQRLLEYVPEGPRPRLLRPGQPCRWAPEWIRVRCAWL